MEIVIIILIGISLSMDAFSLSLAYGSKNLENKKIKILSIIVGAFHFFMPLLGKLIGSIIMNLSLIHYSFIVPIIFIVIGVNMLLESFKKEEKIKGLDTLELLLFGFAVSVDSFSVGIGLKNITEKYLLSSFVFSFSSFIFTYIGLKLGKKINNRIGNIAPILGGIILIIIGILYLFK